MTPAQKTGLFLVLLLICLVLAFQYMVIGLCLIYDKDLLVQIRLIRLVKQTKGEKQGVNMSGSLRAVKVTSSDRHDTRLPSCFAPASTIKSGLFFLFH